MKKLNWLICIVTIAVCTGFFFIYTSDCVLTVHDDILTYMQARQGNIWQTALSDARHGRICHIPLTYLLCLPYLPDSAVFVRICSIAAVSFDMLALYSLIKRNIDKTAAYISCLVFISFAFVSNQHNLFVSYIIGHQIPIGFVLLSLSSFTEFYKNNKTRYLIISSVFLFMASVLYEASAAYILLIFFIAMYSSEGNIFKNCYKIIYDMRFHILFTAVYLIVYFAWRKIYPSDYSGAKLYWGNIPQSLITLLKYSFGMTPGLPLAAMLIKKYVSIKEIIKQTDITVFIAPLITAVSFYIAFPKIKKPKNTPALIFFYITGMLIPNIIISFTTKYTEWTQSNSYSYVTSFYSYFMMIPLSLLILKCIFKGKIKKPFLILLSSLVFLISLCACVNNIAWNIYFGKNLKRYEAFRNAVADEYFENLPSGTIIYIPDYSGIHNDMNTTSSFASIYTTTDLTFENEKSELDFSHTVVYMKYESKTGNILISKIDENFNNLEEYKCISAD